MTIQQAIQKVRHFLLQEDPSLVRASAGIDDGTSLSKICLKGFYNPIVNFGKGTGLFTIGVAESTTAIFTGAVGLVTYPICKNSLATRSWIYVQDGASNMMLGICKVFPLVGNILLSHRDITDTKRD